MKKIRIVIFILVFISLALHTLHASTVNLAFLQQAKTMFLQIFENKVIWPTLAITLIAMWLYFFICLIVTKAKSKPQVIVPVYKVPENLSPGECRYVLDGSFDEKAFTGMLLQLTAKKVVKIESDDKKTYTATLLTIHSKNLNEAEVSFVSLVFAKSPTLHLPLTRGDRMAMVLGYDSVLDKTFGQSLFVSRAWLEWPPIIIVALILAALSSQDSFFTKFAFAYVPVCYAMKVLIVGYIRAKGSLIRKIGVLFLKFIGIAICMLVLFHSRNHNDISSANVFESFTISGIMMANFLISAFIVKLTPKAQKLRVQILGFRKYLEATEEQRLNFINPPKMTPEIYDQYLPYAFALGLSQKWASKFDKTINQKTMFNSVFDLTQI
jgi:hypothetical protein